MVYFGRHLTPETQVRQPNPCQMPRGLTILESQLVSSGEQNCPLGMQGAPQVTLWPLLTHVHRTVSPTLMLISFGTNAKPCPTDTSKICLVADGTPFGTGCPL